MKGMIKHKILALAIGSVLLPVLVISILMVIQKSSVNKKVGAELDILVKDEIEQIAHDVYGLCQTANDLVQQKVMCDLNVAREMLNLYGTVELNTETTIWQASNQFTKTAMAINLPQMMVGGTWLKQNKDLSISTPVVDDVKKLVGGTCTIFQRMNEQGDMLRVATNVETLDHTRAIGTYIPATNPDGTPNPVVSAVMRGERYLGRAFVVNAWYVTAYEPIRDNKSKIVGMLYVGVKQEAVESLRKAIMEVTVGKTGYIYILGGKGDQKGHYIISHKGERDGENIWEAKDADGRYFIQSIVNKAMGLKKGMIDFERYPWRNTGESHARMKIAAIAYFEPWDWVIGAGSYEDDFYEARNKVDSALGSLIVWLFIGGTIVLLVGITLALMIGNKISRPIGMLAEVSDRLAIGDIKQEIDYNSHDETGKLAESFRNMIQSLSTKADIATQIAMGNLDVKVEAVSSEDLLGKAMVSMKDSIKAMVDDVNILAKSVLEGRLSARADASKHGGDFGKIVQGINATLDAAINPINEAAANLEKMAAKDLTVRIKSDYQGDHARIKQALNKAVENLDESLQQVIIAADQVNSASSQISSGSQALAQGASEQASSLQEVSSNLQEMSAMIKQNAQNAKEARALSERSRETTAKGEESMTRLSDAIDKIKTSADETAKIVKTIDDIAFQTNLLALNAAVEAARAGDAGKGFAVVAEEVRNLAMRSAEAAKNTARMIEESIKNSDNGVTINQEVLAHLKEINGQVRKVSEVVAEIAAASEQQNEGIDQINTAVDQMNQVTQQTASNSEESASAAEELASQAEEMRIMVSAFQLSKIDLLERRREEEVNRPVQKMPSSKLAKTKRVKEAVGKATVNSKGQLHAQNDHSLIPFDEQDNDEQILKEF